MKRKNDMEEVKMIIPQNWLPLVNRFHTSLYVSIKPSDRLLADLKTKVTPKNVESRSRTLEHWALSIRRCYVS